MHSLCKSPSVPCNFVHKLWCFAETTLLTGVAGVFPQNRTIYWTVYAAELCFQEIKWLTNSDGGFLCQSWVTFNEQRTCLEDEAIKRYTRSLNGTGGRLHTVNSTGCCCCYRKTMTLSCQLRCGLGHYETWSEETIKGGLCPLYLFFILCPNTWWYQYLWIEPVSLLLGKYASLIVHFMQRWFPRKIRTRPESSQERVTSIEFN